MFGSSNVIVKSFKDCWCTVTPREALVRGSNSSIAKSNGSLVGEGLWCLAACMCMCLCVHMTEGN